MARPLLVKTFNEDWRSGRKITKFDTSVSGTGDQELRESGEVHFHGLIHQPTRPGWGPWPEEGSRTHDSGDYSTGPHTPQRHRRLYGVKNIRHSVETSGRTLSDSSCPRGFYPTHTRPHGHSPPYTYTESSSEPFAGRIVPDTPGGKVLRVPVQSRCDRLPCRTPGTLLFTQPDRNP